MITREEIEKVAKQYHLKIYSRTVTVRKDQKLGHGAFGYVYRISRRRVIKIFKTYGEEGFELANLKDEIKGARTLKDALPIKGIQRVRFYDRHRRKIHTTYGLIKQYLTPLYKYSRKFQKQIEEKIVHASWDSYLRNYGIDSHGRLYLFDTGTEKAFGKLCHQIYNPWSY